MNNPSPHEEPFDGLEQLGVSKEVIDKIKNRNLLQKEIAEGASLQEIFNFSDEAMDSFYKAARHLFEKQNYKEAADAFFFLTHLNPYVSTYWLGLGMSEHLGEDYHAALMAYSMTALLDTEDPLPHYHLGNCYKSIGDLENAAISYSRVLHLCSDSPQHLRLKESVAKYLP